MPPITNSLETERRLEELGFPPPQARGLAVLFEETAVAAQQDLKSFIAAQIDLLRSEVRAMEERLRAEMKAMEERLRAEMKAMDERLRAELHVTNEELRGELHVTNEELRGEFHKGQYMQLFWFITTQGILIAGYLALAKFFFPGGAG